MYQNDMLHSLPQIYREDEWLQALLQAIADIAAAFTLDAESLPKQILMDQATWALPIYERALGITPAPNVTDDARRTAIEAKWKSGGKCDMALLQAIADSWKNGNVDIRFEGGTIVVTFVGEYGVPSDLATLENALDEAKPAHLPISYVFRYLLVRDVQGMTIDTLQQTKINQFAGGGA